MEWVSMPISTHNDVYDSKTSITFLKWTDLRFKQNQTIQKIRKNVINLNKFLEKKYEYKIIPFYMKVWIQLKIVALAYTIHYV